MRLGLVVVVLLFVPGWLYSFEGPKALVAVIMGGSALAALLAHALSSPARVAALVRSAWARHRTPLVLDAVVVLLVLVACIATAGGVSPRLSLLGELSQRGGLVSMLALAGFYGATRATHHRGSHGRSTCDTILVAAAGAAVYALVQSLGADPFAWADAAYYSTGTHGVLRPFGTLGNPTLLGAVLAPAASMVVLRLVRRSGGVLANSLLLAGLVMAVASTLSRGAWLATAVGVLVAMGSGVAERQGRTARIRASHGVWLIAALGVAVLVAARTPVLVRLGESLAGGSAQVHLEIARGAWALWRAHPWFGAGPDTFGLLFPGVQSLAYGGGLWHGLPLHAHSVALQALVGMGVAGGVVGLVGFLVLVMRWRQQDAPDDRARLEPIVGCVSLVVFGAFNEPGIAGAVLFAVLAALSVGTHGDSASPDPPVSAHAATAAALLCILLLAAQALPEARALAAAGRARAALQRSLLAGPDERVTLTRSAAEQAADAARLRPREDELWRLSAECELARARATLALADTASARDALELARRAALRAEALQPLRAANAQAVGSALAGQARLAAGVPGAPGAVSSAVDSAFARARALAPRDARILIGQARVRLEQGEAAAALDLARDLTRHYPEAAIGHALVAAAQLMLGERDGAEQALRAAVAARWTDDQAAEREVARSYLNVIAAPESMAH